VSEADCFRFVSTSSKAPVVKRDLPACASPVKTAGAASSSGGSSSGDTRQQVPLPGSSGGAAAGSGGESGAAGGLRRRVVSTPSAPSAGGVSTASPAPSPRSTVGAAAAAAPGTALCWAAVAWRVVSPHPGVALALHEPEGGDSVGVGMLAVACSDASVITLSADTLAETGVYKGLHSFAPQPSAVTFSANGRFLVTGSPDSNMALTLLRKGRRWGGCCRGFCSLLFLLLLLVGVAFWWGLVDGVDVEEGKAWLVSAAPPSLLQLLGLQEESSALLDDAVIASGATEVAPGDEPL
jgi:hypothetical protein